LAPAAADSLRYGQGLFWAVERDGTPPSHVFGTFHSTDPQILALAAPVRAAFDRAESVVLELVLDDATRLTMARAMVLPPGRALQDMVGPALSAQAVAVGADYGLGAAQIGQLKPWAVALLFSLPPEEQIRQAAGQLALDSWLQREAQTRGTAVFALEMIEEQIAMFDGLTLDQQRAFLQAAAKERTATAQAFAQIKQAYLRQDLDAVQALSRQDFSGIGDDLRRVLEARIIVERNRRMVARMVERLDRGGAFVAVGALHLPGDQGVLALLAQRGYRIRRVE
jgi:hypothetical protein